MPHDFLFFFRQNEEWQDSVIFKIIIIIKKNQKNIYIYMFRKNLNRRTEIKTLKTTTFALNVEKKMGNNVHEF